MVEECRVQEEDPFDKPPSVTEAEVEIVLRRSELQMMIDVMVSSIMKLIDDRIISGLQLCTAETR